MEDSKISPFLKWAGGKRWFIHNLDGFVPHFDGTYYEPFIGSGAMFFHLAPTSSVISDYNQDLILTYRAIKHDWEKVLGKLKYHHRRHTKDYYYEMRSSKPRAEYIKAAKFIYLNRTCWNGLYRVNLKGEFNVPIGTKKNVVLATDNFSAVSERLKRCEILCGDFEQVIDKAGAGDFLFIDPPYTVKHNHNSFIKYNEKLFSWEDQERLKGSIDRAVSRGAKVLVTNADHCSVRELYKDYKQVQVERYNVISGKAQYRGKFEELIVKCGYE